MAVEVAAQVEIVELGVTYTTPFTLELDPGTYTLRATYPVTGETQTRTTTITGGVTTREDFYFAAPPPVEYTLAISATAGGTTNPAPGSYRYPAGTSVTVTAVPATGYRLRTWILDGVARPPTDTINVLMDMDHTLRAEFELIPAVEYTLTISAVGGTTNPAPGSYKYAAGTTVRVTAIPVPGYAPFHHWELDGVTRTENPIDVLMDKDHTLVAVFAPVTYFLTITSTVGGTTAPAPGTYSYTAGTTARVTAYPDSGYRFVRWELDTTVRTENPIDIVMDRDYSLRAIFEAIAAEYTLSISSTVGGTTDPAPGTYLYPAGSVAVVIAYPGNGYIFDHWLIDGVTRETANPINLLMDTDHTLSAVFIVAPPLPPIYKTIALAAGVAAAVGLAYIAGKKR